MRPPRFRPRLLKRQEQMVFSLDLDRNGSPVKECLVSLVLVKLPAAPIERKMEAVCWE